MRNTIPIVEAHIEQVREELQWGRHPIERQTQLRIELSILEEELERLQAEEEAEPEEEPYELRWPGPPHDPGY